ncbi:hypothetical protein HN873_010959 [Arachis hypogaea]
MGVTGLGLASLSATPIACERPLPTTSQPPPPSSQRSPSTGLTQDLLADRAAQHCSTQTAPSAQQVGTTLASRTHHHPQSLATRKSHPAGHDHPLTQDHSIAYCKEDRRELERSLEEAPKQPSLVAVPQRLATVAGLAFCLRRAATVSTVPVLFQRVSPSIVPCSFLATDLLCSVLAFSSRLQQVLADFLLICINFTPTRGQVVVAASLTKDQLGKSVHLAYLEISITHDGVGVPETLLNQMFGRDGQESEEGISLLISRKLLKLMNGDVRYLREAG